LVIPPHYVGVRLAVAGGEAGPGAQRLRRAETADVADLGAEDGGHRAPDAVEGLGSLIALVGAQALVDQALEDRHLPVVELDQVADGLDADAVGLGELHGVEVGSSRRTEHVGEARQHPLLAHHRVHLGLEARAQLDQLRSVAHQLSPLPHLFGGDPRIGEAPEAQEVSEVATHPVRASAKAPAAPWG
jgi:hypothetical protein